MALPLAPNAELKQIATGFALAEGPVYSRRGYLLFTDIRNQKIHKWENGKLTTIRENSNKANGLTFDHQGRLLTAEGGGRVTRTEKNGAITVLADKDLKGPNDIVYSIDGSIYFTDLPAGKVYQITRTGPVTVHEIEPDGRLKPGKPFAPLTVDGLKTDESGNVWMAAPEGITVHTSNGEPLGTIKTPERPTNLAFSGAALYITTPTTVHQIQTKVSGTRTF